MTTTVVVFVVLALVGYGLVRLGDRITKDRYIRFAQHIAETANISEHAYRAQLQGIAESTGAQANVSSIGLAMSRFLVSAWIAAAYSVAERTGHLSNLARAHFKLEGEAAMHLVRGVALSTITEAIKDDRELQQIKAETDRAYELIVSLLSQEHGSSSLSEPAASKISALWVRALALSASDLSKEGDLSIEVAALWFVNSGSQLYEEWRGLLWKK